MVFGWRSDRRPPAFAVLYDGLVRAARNRALYADIGVADTIEGRIELLMLHVGLAMERLSRGAGGREAAGRLSDRFFADMEATLREFGLGDKALARRLADVAEAFFGRLAAYRAALAAGDDAALAAALARNVPGVADPLRLDRLAGYVRALVTALAATPDDRLAAGEVGWPAIVP